MQVDTSRPAASEGYGMDTPDMDAREIYNQNGSETNNSSSNNEIENAKEQAIVPIETSLSEVSKIRPNMTRDALQELRAEYHHTMIKNSYTPPEVRAQQLQDLCAKAGYLLKQPVFDVRIGSLQSSERTY